MTLLPDNSPVAVPETAGAVLKSPDQLLSLLDQWVEMGWLRALDVALSRFLAAEAVRAGQPASPLLLMAVALTSHQLGRGHVCLDLWHLKQEGYNDALSLPPEDETSPDRRWLPSDILSPITETDWEHALSHPLLVAVDGRPLENSPLVAHGLRLYLRRYWDYEQGVYRHLSSRMATLSVMADSDGAAASALAAALAALFPQGEAGVDWQKVACGNAARQGFSVITGGPGTGKTTTVVKLLAALQHVALSAADVPRALRINLAAPTGKAAARLNESIAGAVTGLDLGGLPDSEVLRQSIPTEVTTLHRLLGAIPGSRKFRHHRDNPLVVDVLVVDEASMVDLEMMARVLDALPAGARLILLGDKDQLASVDAGAVLGELCQRAWLGHYRSATASWLRAVTACEIPAGLTDERGTTLDQSITLLRKSYRFDERSGIGQLAQAVNNGSDEGGSASLARGIFEQCFEDLALVPLPAKNHAGVLERHAVEGGSERFVHAGQGRKLQGREVPPPVGYRHYLTRMVAERPDRRAGTDCWDHWAQCILSAYGKFQVLAALRRGEFGVEGLNERIAGQLKSEGLISSTEGWYAGRPVLVTRNDYSLGLMNGDIGITLSVPARQWQEGQLVVDQDNLVLRVAFPAGDGSGDVRWVLPSRLQRVETVFAMTVHKSQGSEFEHACLIMPDRISPVLTRELVYTGITRARHWFSLGLPNDDVFDLALERQVTRSSGLGEWLLNEG